MSGLCVVLLASGVVCLCVAFAFDCALFVVCSLLCVSQFCVVFYWCCLCVALAIDSCVFVCLCVCCV